MTFQQLALACALAGLSRALAVEAESVTDPTASWQSWPGTNPHHSYGHGSSYYHQPQHQIPYRPFSGQKLTLTAHCEDDQTINGEQFKGVINLYQKPGMAMKIKGEGTFVGLAIGDIYKVRIQEYSYLDCSKNGQEFNPLQKSVPKTSYDPSTSYYGPSYPYGHSDPNRGRIADIIIDEAGKVTIDKQILLQNLQGPDAIVGKSINIYKVDSATTEITLADVPLACCSIVCDNPYSFYQHYTPTNPYGLGYDYYKHLQGGSGHGSYGSSHYPSYGGSSPYGTSSDHNPYW